MTADLRVEWWSDSVLVLTVDRPQRRNPVDHELLAALAAAAPRSAVEGTRASLAVAARSLSASDALAQSDRWRLRAAASSERRSAFEVAKKRLGWSI